MPSGRSMERLPILQQSVSITVAVEALIEAARIQERQRIWQQQQQLYKISDPLLHALRQLDKARDALFNSLFYVPMPGWKQTLKLLQDKFNSEVTTTQQVVRTLLKASEATIILQASLTKAENDLILSASEMNQAVTAAIAEDDGGVMLRRLADESGSSLAEIFETQMKTLSTDHLAQDRYIGRGGLYIGVRCNQLEGAEYKGIRKQWRAVYDELKSNRHKLTGDQAEAWNYFTYKKPHSMTQSELRIFEQEISRLKSATRIYTGEASGNFRQSSDKT
jgi:hypothetical protein